MNQKTHVAHVKSIYWIPTMASVQKACLKIKSEPINSVSQRLMIALQYDQHFLYRMTANMQVAGVFIEFLSKGARSSPWKHETNFSAHQLLSGLMYERKLMIFLQSLDSLSHFYRRSHLFSQVF